MKITSYLLGAMMLAPTALQAATLDAVPMQGGMIMPMLFYNTNDGALHVMLDPEVPQLTPLLVSHPGDGFDPADPWYDSLDPGRQGLAFSRRYGFVMATMTDPLPAGMEIWIRMLSGSPGLSAYRCMNTAPKAWEPIFGTGGTTNALHWDGVMFHPAFTAPPGTNTFTATFEACLRDSVTGEEAPGSSTGPFVFNWTDVPDGRPILGIGQRIVVFWPASTTDYVLEGTDTLTNATWTLVTNAPVTLEGRFAVVLEPGETRKFFRMKYAP